MTPGQSSTYVAVASGDMNVSPDRVRLLTAPALYVSSSVGSVIVTQPRFCGAVASPPPPEQPAIRNATMSSQQCKHLIRIYINMYIIHASIHTIIM